MQIPVHITIRGFDQSAALEDRIREKAARLDSFHPRITSCRVVVEESHKHRHQGRHFAVRFDIRVPGREIVASHHHEDVYVALQDAFDAVVRQLKAVDAKNDREREGFLAKRAKAEEQEE